MKRQTCEPQQFEKSYPGIKDLEKDEEGNVILSEISDSDKELPEISAKSK